MVKAETERAASRTTLFDGLKKYSASEAAGLNAYRRLFEASDKWKTWIEEIFTELLEIPKGMRIDIAQSNDVSGQEQRNYRFEKGEVIIGRTEDSDISLPLNVISRRHARIFLRDDTYYVEDLNSVAGTYINRHRLKAGETHALIRGDEILVVPYVLRVTPEGIWGRDDQIAVSYSSQLSGSLASGFALNASPGLSLFQADLHPDLGSVIFGISREFLKVAVARLIRGRIAELVEADLQLVEFLALAVLERANRELRFPFQFSLKALDPKAAGDEPGIAIEASTRLTGARAAIKVFLPHSCLSKAKSKPSAGLPKPVRQQLAWQLAVHVGFVDLTLDDLAKLETGDILVYTAESELVLPQAAASQAPERGWRMERIEDSPCRFQMQTFFERIHMEDAPQNNNEPKTESKPDLNALPVRVHVVLSQMEFSLDQLEALSEGAVIELDCDKSGQVQLVANGRVFGAGELVDVDGKLGVEIRKWGTE